MIESLALARWLAAYLATVTRNALTLFVLDDMHRADDLTLQLLRRVVELGSAPNLLLAMFRPEEVTREWLRWGLRAVITPQRLKLCGQPLAGLAVIAGQHGLQTFRRTTST